MDMVKQYEVYWISLDPTQGSEIAKTRPCVVVSPNELNQHLRTVIVAPITSTIKEYPWRVKCQLNEKQGSIATDQVRAVDKVRLGKKVSQLNRFEIESLKKVLGQLFVE
jgi:mRNA interferase MazF